MLELLYFILQDFNNPFRQIISAVSMDVTVEVTGKEGGYPLL